MKGRFVGAHAGLALAVAWLFTLRSLLAAEPMPQPLDPAVGPSVHRALAYLARQQQPDGSITSFEESAPRGRSTAQAVVAWLASGQTPSDGRHALALHNALGFLLRTSPTDGYFGYGDDSGMAGQSWITIALAESYGVEADAAQRAQLAPLLREARAAILSLQDLRAAPDAGGWSEQGAAGSNLAVTALTVLALKSLADAGVDVPDDAFRRAAAFAESCARPKGAGFADKGQSPTALSTASGAFILLSARPARGNELKAVTNALVGMRPGESDDDHEAAFFAALVARKLGGDNAALWNPIWDALRKGQSDDGAWLPAHADSPGTSTVSTTAMGVLTLTTAYRWLPVYSMP